jgi:hypothetical protein
LVFQYKVTQDAITLPDLEVHNGYGHPYIWLCMPILVWLGALLQCGVIEVGVGSCVGKVPRGVLFRCTRVRHPHSQGVLDVSIMGHGINDVTYKLKQLNVFLQ